MRAVRPSLTPPGCFCFFHVLQTGVVLLISALCQCHVSVKATLCQCHVSVIATLCLGYSNLIAALSQPYRTIIIARRLSQKRAKTQHFPRKQTVHGCTVVRRGSSSLDLGLSGLDRGAGWPSQSMAGARSADLDSQSSADLDAALAGVFRRVTSDEEKVE